MMPTYKISSEQLENPTLLAVLASLNAASEALGVRYYIVGALARDLLLEYVHGIRAPQATRDVDVAVAVQDWARYEQLIDALKNTYRFEPTNWPYRLRSAEGLYVDVIPFGLVEGPGRTISWPPHEFVMTMLGFEEAYQARVRIVFDEDLAVTVASPAGLGLLKLIAWDDRKDRTSRDAEDLCFLMRTYYEAFSNVIFEQHFDLLEEEDFDVDYTSARAFGRAVGAIAASSEAVAATVIALLRRETTDPDRSALVDHMGASCIPVYQRRFESLRSFLQGVEEGVEDVT